MKILYGVQGTGNGHITRARMMARHLARRDVEVQFLFSGRPAERYFDMEVFGDFQLRDGLTFATDNGRINVLKTITTAKPLRFIRDVRALDVADYDLVVTDFEPVSAWAARLQGKTAIGIGHQYAFGYPEVPQSGVDFRNQLIMRYFAPTRYRLGLHWDHFNAPVVPPIVDTEELQRPAACGAHIVVYLPFENQQTVAALLQQFPEQHFIQYSPELVDRELGHIQQRKTSLHSFKHDLCSASGVICNSGFELISECLHLGIPALTRPVSGQSEQLGNAAALRQLGLATVMDSLDHPSIANWLAARPQLSPQSYPDVAEAICDWLLSGQWQDSAALVESLWQRRDATAEADDLALGL